MKRILFLLSLAACALAQVQTVPNTTFPAVRTILNSNFTYLDTYKAKIGSCASGYFAVQTTATGVVCLQVAWSVLTGVPSTFTPPNPGASSLGGVRSLTCTGTDKLSAIGTDGIPVCSADATGEAGSGITTLNTLTGTTQTFSRTNDTNVTLTLTPSGTDHNFALGWSGTLAIARGGTGAASTSQNFAFIGPTSGSGAPSFRALVAGDIPSLAESKITNLVTDLAGKAASNASTTVNGQACALGSTCTVADSTKEPALGNPASDGYVLKSTALGVRTWETLGAGHTQNTDTGTTQATFQIDSGNSGPKLKNNAGVLEARNAADDDYADFRAKTVSAGDGTVAGEATLYELSSNGSNYISWLVPDSITNTLRLKIPDASPSAGDSMLFGGPSSNISVITFGKPAALAANGANCSASQIPLGVDASGAVEGCYQPSISTLSDASSVVTPSTSNTFTNKTLDAEGTGNSITIPTTVWLPGAGCNNATASSFWDLPTSTPAVPTCVTGTNTQKGVLAFADTSGGFSAQNEYLLPDDFSGNIDAKIIWSTSATSGNAKWSLSTICTAVGATETDDPAFNTASTVTTAAPGTANRLQTSSISSLTITGCAAGEYLHVKIFRDGNDASDTIAATANLIGVELKIRRAM